jgi:MFS family permease
VSRPTRTGALTVVVVLLFTAGWATNHFAAIIPVLRESEGLSATVLAGAFGVYALGLLPGLLGGGALSDRVGRRPVVLTGSAVAAAGNLLMLCWHPAAGIYTGRLVVGVGVGLAMSAGTAWAADLGGRKGTTIAGTVLTAGFACGPLVSGLVAQLAPDSVDLAAPFTITIALSAGTILAAVRLTPPARPTSAAPAPVVAPAAPEDVRGVGRALARSVPMALWVFSTVTVPLIVLAGRVGGDHNGPWLPGVAAALALGTGVAAQVVARRAEWGPRAGVVGALLAAAGFALAARVDASADVALFVLASVVLGSAYGLCLRAGLVDVEALTPSEHRGTTIGVYYVCTYLGFGLPVLLESLREPVGTLVPLLALSGLALAAAALRTVQLRTTAVRA